MKIGCNTRIVVDLDDTICRPNHHGSTTHEKYAKAQPIHATIIWLQNAKAAGAYIIIHTARRMLTHKGDLDKIHADVGQVTRDWLDTWQVPFDELVFGKPYGDIYIDDKAMNVENIW